MWEVAVMVCEEKSQNQTRQGTLLEIIKLDDFLTSFRAGAGFCMLKT